MQFCFFVPAVLLSFVLSSAGQASQGEAVPNKPIASLDSSVISFVDAYETRDRVEDRARTLRALAHISDQSMEVAAGQKTAQKAAQEIRETVTREFKFDPETFASALQALKPLDSEVQGASDILKTYTSSALLGLLALLPDPISAGASFFLGV
jgi:hypothetical protein